MPSWNVDQSIEINADVGSVYDLVSDFRTWTSWSPWLIAEPTTQVEISPIGNAVRSKYHWVGKIVGEGQLTHESLVPRESVRSRLEFIKPMRSVCSTGLDLQPIGEKTKLTWWIRGNLPWFVFWLKPKIVCMVGLDFSRGLAMIKELAESGKVSSRSDVLGVEAIAPLRLAGLRGRCAIRDVQAEITKLLPELSSRYRNEGIPLEGALVVHYNRLNTTTGHCEFLVGRAIPDTLILPEHAGLCDLRIPAKRAFHVKHFGLPMHLLNAWSVADRISEYQRLKIASGDRLEIYSPAAVPGQALDASTTDLYLLLR